MKLHLTIADPMPWAIAYCQRDSRFFQYDDTNRLTKLVHSETTTAPTSGWGSDPLAGYEFVYDSSSRIASIDSYLDGLSEYTHDDTNQLVGADHNTADDEAYEYDSNGNRIMSGYDIDSNNQLYSDGTYTYTYDDEGNRETRTKISNSYVTRYYWDHRNRLVKVEEYDAGETTLLSSVEQTYDPFNQWIRRSFDEDGTGGDPAVDTFFVRVLPTPKVRNQTRRTLPGRTVLQARHQIGRTPRWTAG